MLVEYAGGEAYYNWLIGSFEILNRYLLMLLFFNIPVEVAVLHPICGTTPSADGVSIIERLLNCKLLGSSEYLKYADPINILP